MMPPKPPALAPAPADVNRLQPSFTETLALLVRLRFKLFLRGFTRKGIIAGVISSIFALAISCSLGVGSYWIFTLAMRAHMDFIWLTFIMSMFSFLLGLFWILWPVIAAQIDEASELSRFFSYPVSPRRLYFIHTSAAFLEPSTMFFYPPLAGACLALAQRPYTNVPLMIIAVLSFVFMITASGQFLKSLFLNVMKSRRSGEILTACILGLLGLSVFLPRVDASWLFARMDAFGSSAEDLDILLRASDSIRKTPPGWLASSIIDADNGMLMSSAGKSLAMIAVGLLSWWAGLSLLLRFYHGGRDPKPKRSLLKKPLKETLSKHKTGIAMKTAWPGIDGRTSAVFAKELRTLTAGPKTRLLFAVPFFLVIILKIIGAPQLFFYLWGDKWTSIFMSLLSIYVLSVSAGQLFSNGFGFDGHGIRQVFFYPSPPIKWFRGRNLAQAAVAWVQILLLWMLVFLSMENTSTLSAALPLSGFAMSLPILLGLGNLLSIHYPRRFYFTLARRDRPAPFSFFAVIAALAACTAAATGLFSAHKIFLDSIGTGLVPGVILTATGLLLYHWMTGKAAKKLSLRKEALIDSIAC